MKKILIIASGILPLLSCDLTASADLDRLLAELDPVKTLNTLITIKDPLGKNLCDEIKDPSFYQVAESKKLGPIKRNKLINACSNVNYEVADLKKAVQGEKKIEKAPEKVQLRHIDFAPKAKGVEAEGRQLELIKRNILQNAELLGRKVEYEQKLIIAQQKIDQARDYYGNLSAAIYGMREDLKEIKQRRPMEWTFQYFDLDRYENSSPEEFIEALNSILPREKNNVLSPDSKYQLKIASDLLMQANENLRTARADLEKINREMLMLNS